MTDDIVNEYMHVYMYMVAFIYIITHVYVYDYIRKSMHAYV